jgi:hypothetical protein
MVYRRKIISSQVVATRGATIVKKVCDTPPSFHNGRFSHILRRVFPPVCPLVLRQAAEFFEAFAAFEPGLGIEDADLAAFVERQARAGLTPEEDVLRRSQDGARLLEPGRVVRACGDDALAVRAEGHGTDLALMLQGWSDFREIVARSRGSLGCNWLGDTGSSVCT